MNERNSEGPRGEVVVSAESDIGRFLIEVIDAHQGPDRYPFGKGLLLAVVQELGNVSRALLVDSSREVREGCARLAAVAMRLAIEGDPTLPDPPILMQDLSDWGYQHSGDEGAE